MAESRKPKRADIWDVDLNPTQGHEQGGRRPALVISVDQFNASPAELVTIIPITSKHQKIRSHVAVDPPEGGLTERSYVKTEEIRTISTMRLIRRRGVVSEATMAQVASFVKILLGL